MAHMKKISALLVIVLLLGTLLSCAADKSNATAPIPTAGDYVIDGTPVNAVALDEARFTFDAGLPGFSFVFSIPAEQYAHIITECTNVHIYATVTDDDGGSFVAEVNDLGNRFGLWKFEVSVGGLFRADYLTAYRATLVLGFNSPDGTARTVTAKSGKFTLYDVAYREYCDRNDVETDLYPYPAGSDFSPYPDLSHHYAVLSSALFLTLSDTEVSSDLENRIYCSPYDVSHFDGVLTVSMKNAAPIADGLLDAIFVNGNKIYFEIHDGIIRVITEDL